MICLRPVDGSKLDAIGEFEPIDGGDVESATYPRPDPSAAGDFTGTRLVHDTVRLNLRSGAGPFRSLHRLSVEPRPYQYVLLLMALRLDPVRLLIADDVSVGKTIDAGMVARELLDRGAIRRIAVLCAPHLCDQWAEELVSKFHIEATVVQSSTMARLERGLPPGHIGVFRHYPHLVASIDFVKSDRWRRSFIDDCPDFLIVDEAHTAARPRGDRGGQQHQRYALLRDLAKDPERHVVLTTATPHGGIEESFRSLLGLLDAAFDKDEGTEVPRGRLSPHVIQRRRADLKHWLGENTPFPDRESAEYEYALSADHVALFDDVLAYCRKSVAAATGGAAQQRVRYWAAIAILRCLLLQPRRRTDAGEAGREDRRCGPAGCRRGGRPLRPPGARLLRRRSRAGLRAESGPGRSERGAHQGRAAPDRRIPQARAVSRRRADQRQAAAHRGSRRLIPGRRLSPHRVLPPHRHRAVRRSASAGATGEEAHGTPCPLRHRRRRRLRTTGGDRPRTPREPVRVLVTTDCLSDGVNLQEWFDAVLHYDLPWNPNRLEQREGRVDRYGQAKKTVRTGLLYGTNNQVDLVVLRVLIEKARTIRQRLGISVPVPVESEQVVQAVIDRVLLHDRADSQQLRLALEHPGVNELHEQMDQSAERERRRRGHYAQAQIDPDAVRREVDAVRRV